MARSDRSQKRTGHLRIFVHAQEGSELGVVGIGIALRDRSNRPIDWAADRATLEPGSDPLLHALEHGLEVAAQLGARNATVFVDDPAVVRQVNREGDVPRGSIPAFMRVRALLNQLRKASVRYITPEQNREARRLAQAAAANEPASEMHHPDTLSLFPTAVE